MKSQPFITQSSLFHAFLRFARQSRADKFISSGLITMDRAEMDIFSSNREPLGQRSICADYFQARTQDYHSECIFRCIRRGGRFYATDIPVGENEAALGLDVLEKSSRPWWKQFSLYSAVTVQQVQVMFRVSAPNLCLIH